MKTCAIAGLFWAFCCVMPAMAGAGKDLDCGPVSESALSGALTPADNRILASGDIVDTANLVSDLINRLEVVDPSMSYAHLVDALVAAYCPLVAGAAELSLEEKEARVRRFAALVQRETVINPSSPGTLIIANVALPPDVYRKLSLQAAAENVSVAKLMAKILTSSAGP